MIDQIDEIISKLQAVSPLPDDYDDAGNKPASDDETINRLNRFMEILSEIGNSTDTRLIQPLIESFGYGTAYGVNWTILHLLEKFDRTELFFHLVKATQQGSRGSRMWSVVMLRRTRDPKAIPYFRSLLEDSAELVRSEAIDALGLFGEA